MGGAMLGSSAHSRPAPSELSRPRIGGSPSTSVAAVSPRGARSSRPLARCHGTPSSGPRP
eukprot:12708902-Heterocapsa_arctica.AAC.1